MDVEYQPSSFIPCPLCNQRVYLAYINKMQSFRRILPKISLLTVEGEPVDPQPAVLVTQEELVDIQNRVRESLISARKRHVAGALTARPDHIVADFQMLPL